MTVGAVLLLYATALGALGPLALRDDRWLARAPRLGATLLLAAALSVLTALFLAGLTIAMPGTALSSGLSDLLGACIHRLRSAYATPGGAAVAGAGLTLSATIAARTAWALITGCRRRRSERHRQRALIALCGRQPAASDSVILEQSRPAVYCVGGRAPAVIMTSGAVELLTAPQLAAVLAHEHAHLRARHHRVLAAAAVAGAALPELPLIRRLPQQVRGLLEMHADDLAARSHDPETLATALVAVATSWPTPTSAGALAAADTEAVARIRRLLLPPAMLSGRGRTTVRAAVAAFGLVPLVLALTPAAVAATEPPLRQTHSVTAAAAYGSADRR